MSAAETSLPSFGTYITALRLCWGWDEFRKCFIRVTPQPIGICVELAPPVRKLLTGSAPHGNHACWWNEPENINLSPVIKKIRSVKRYIQIMLDENGELMKRSK